MDNLHSKWAELASLGGRARWEKATRADRKEQGRKMREGKEKKRAERLRVQRVRSRAKTKQT